MERYVLPLKFDQNVLILAMVEPTDVITINEVIEILKQHGYDIKEVNIIITTKSRSLKR